MIKFAWKLNDKMMIVNGGTARFLGANNGIKMGYRDGADVPSIETDDYFKFAWTEAGYRDLNAELANSTINSLYLGNSGFSSYMGSFLNKSSMCKVGKYIYTSHHCYNSSTPLFDTAPGINPKLVQWDGVESNVNINIFPSSCGGRIVHGYSQSNLGGFNNSNHVGVLAGFEPGLINYNGNVLGFGLAGSVINLPALLGFSPDGGAISDPSGIEKWGARNYLRPIGHYLGSSCPLYYSFLYQPDARNGSGLTTYNFYSPDINLPPFGAIEHPNWICSEYTASKLEADERLGIMSGLALLNYNINSMEEYKGMFYASSAMNVMQFDWNSNSGVQRIVNTNGNKYMPSPKWLNKFNGKLYMFAASGTVSEIIPNDDNVGATVTDLIDLSYVYPYNINYGGLHARMWGLERATKSEICTFGDEMLVFAQMGSGTYYLATSGDATTWTNRTSTLPDTIRYGAGNIHTIQDEHSGKLYIYFTTMVQNHGIFGLTTFGDEPGNIGHLYEYDGTTFTKINWFANPSWQSCGGFMGFDYQGPHIAFPSGLAYPLNESENNEVGPSGEVLAIEPYRKFKFQYNVNSYDGYADYAGGMCHDSKFIYACAENQIVVSKMHSGPLDTSGIVQLDSHLICTTGDSNLCDVVTDGSGYIFVSSRASGVTSFKVDDATGQLTKENMYDKLPLDYFPEKMEKDGNDLYVAADRTGILFYKIKPSGELIKINTYNSTGYTHDVCKHNDRLYATSDYGLETWGINAVGALSYSGISTSTIGDSRKLAYYNGYLYSSTNIDNTVALYSIQTSGARFERFLTVPDLNMYQRMSLMGGDSQFLYFNNDASGLCFYQNDTSGNLIHKHTIPKTQHESERYTALIYPSGEFEWDKHNLTYTLTRGKVYQEYGGLNTWNLHYAFEPTEENSPILIKCRDHAVLDYKIIDELSRNVDVNIEYSDDNGCTWSTCDRFKDYETIQYLGDGITDLASSPSGEWHSFYWDFVKPFGYNVEYPYCQMRITPSISKRN